jgi:thiol-disulfide isomerase/thioredoxin
MRLSSHSFLVALLLSFGADAASAQDREADRVLGAVSDRLESLDAIAFDHSIELNYASQGYHQTSSARGYIEWETQNALGARLRFEESTRVFVYNGSEAFSYDDTQNALGVRPQPTLDDLPARYLQGSLYTLRLAIPTLLSTESIETELLTGEGFDAAFHHVEVRVPRATIGYDGELEPLELDIAVTYLLKIDRQTLLPVEVTKRDPNGDYMRTTLSALDVQPEGPEQGAWYYSSYTDDETRDMYERSGRPLIGAGETAPAWTLTEYPNGPEVSLDEFRGQATLMVLWISHCGYSIAAVPTVNALYDAYRDDGLAVISINPYDSREVIDLFVQNNGPRYPIVQNGQEVVDAYGIRGYPTAVLIDPAGNVVYSGAVDGEGLREAVHSLVRE